MQKRSPITLFLCILLACIMMLSLTACKKEAEYTLEESLQKGKEMTTISPDISREYIINIMQEGQEYKLTGISAGDNAIFSLSIVQNGLISNYKNLLLIQGDDIFLNMNVILNIAESEADFIFSEPLELQNRYLQIPGGKTLISSFTNALSENVLSPLSDARANADTGRGRYVNNLLYNHEQAQSLMGSVSESASNASASLAEQFENAVKSLVGDSVDTYKKSMAYLNDAIDIDTQEEIAEYPLFGETLANIISSEMQSLSNLMNIDGYYMEEGITYSDSEMPKYEHFIGFYDDTEKLFGSFSVTISDLSESSEINAEITTIQMDDFLDIFLANVMNEKGVGYETDDFPYSITYTTTDLTAEESNDLYRAVYKFTFSGKRLASYVVEYYTYEVYIHNALAKKCEAMGMDLLSENTNSLNSGSGSGYLQYALYMVSSPYSSATSPVELFEIIQKNGLPSYSE